jgi:hypothetical protein
MLVTRAGRLPLRGTFGELAAAAGVEPVELRDVYAEGPGVSVSDDICVDEQALAVVVEAFARGDAAMRSFAPAEVPVLWPEHFDIGISVGEVNYGVSSGDHNVPEPYAYVGPWAPREGSFWNKPFGAARPLEDLPDANAVAAFFAEGARRAAGAVLKA